MTFQNSYTIPKFVEQFLINPKPSLPNYNLYKSNFGSFSGLKTTSDLTNDNRKLFVAVSGGTTSFFRTAYGADITLFSLGYSTELNLHYRFPNKKWFLSTGVWFDYLTAKKESSVTKYKYFLDSYLLNIPLTMQRSFFVDKRFRPFLETGFTFGILLHDSYEKCNPDCSTINIYADDVDTRTAVFWNASIGAKLAATKRVIFIGTIRFQDAVSPFININYASSGDPYSDPNFVYYFKFNLGLSYGF